jgi:hypothetical protein
MIAGASLGLLLSSANFAASASAVGARLGAIIRAIGG